MYIQYLIFIIEFNFVEIWLNVFRRETILFVMPPEDSL